jgi:hypothetical protein
MTDAHTGDPTMNTWTYTLRRGHSADPSGGACAMDAVNWLVHGRHGDRPECACPVIGRYVIGINDKMPDGQRQRLLAFLPRIAGSRSAAHQQARAEILARGAVRVLAPIALDAAGLSGEAKRLRALAPDCTMREAARAARAARAAADAAARAAWAARAAGAAGWAAADAAADAAAWAAEAAWAADAAASCAEAAREAAEAAEAAWDAALQLLSDALDAGPQGEPWSATQIADGTAAYRAAGGLVPA